MRTLFTFLTLLAVCAFLFFFAQHHARTENTFRPCTLAEVYGEGFKDMSPQLASKLGLLLLVGLAGLVTAFYPAILVLLLRFAPQVSGWLILAGIIALIGTGANFFLMILSHTSFGFGGTSSSDSATLFFWLITLFQLGFAILSITLGAVSKWGNAAQQWLTT